MNHAAISLHYAFVPRHKRSISHLSLASRQEGCQVRLADRQHCNVTSGQCRRVRSERRDLDCRCTIALQATSHLPLTLDFILQFRRVGDLAHNTVLLMHLGVIRCTQSCHIAPVCSGEIGCVKYNGVQTSQRTDLAVCTDERMVPLNVGPYDRLLIVHVDGISIISSIPNGY